MKISSPDPHPLNPDPRPRVSRAGQSLVEVMVALSILVIGFLGILTLLAQSIHISKNLSEQVTATYLAEEGIELSKNILDYDVYQQRAGQGLGWALGGEDNTFREGGDFQLDYTTCDNLGGKTIPCYGNVPSYSGQSLLFDETTGLYGYEIGVPTPFIREIKVHLVPSNPNEIIVESIVTWGISGQQIDLEDDFYNWHP